MLQITTSKSQIEIVKMANCNKFNNVKVKENVFIFCIDNLHNIFYEEFIRIIKDFHEIQKCYS